MSTLVIDNNTGWVIGCVKFDGHVWLAASDKYGACGSFSDNITAIQAVLIVERINA